MEKKGKRLYKIVRVIPASTMEFPDFRLIREDDDAIISSSESISDVLEDYGEIMDNSDYECELSDYVETIDNSVRTIKEFLNEEKRKNV